MKNDRLKGKDVNTVNLFMVYSPLHCLCAEQIVQHFEECAKNVIFSLKPDFNSWVNPLLWDAVVYLPWPRFDPSPGCFGRIRRTRDNLETVANFCCDARKIVLHTTVIDTEAINYNINFLRKTFPEAEFKVRLFPDGLLNIKRHPLGLLKSLLQYGRMIRRIVCPDLYYYTFSGDRTGSDDQIVDKIYILPQFPHQYNHEKIVELPPFLESLAGTDKLQVKKKALVIGQPLIGFKRIAAEDVTRITSGIYSYLNACGIEEIYYKSHPRERTREYALDHYRELLLDKPLERHLAEVPYGIVIGVYSTGLLTGRMILPDWCQVVSCGINLVNFSTEEERKDLIEVFKKLDVSVLNA